MGRPICQALFQNIFQNFFTASLRRVFCARIMPSALLLYKRKSQATIRSRAIPNPPYKRISKKYFCQKYDKFIFLVYNSNIKIFDFLGVFRWLETQIAA
jgi:hypothetical protein